MIRIKLDKKFFHKDCGSIKLVQTTKTVAEKIRKMFTKLLRNIMKIFLKNNLPFNTSLTIL